MAEFDVHQAFELELQLQRRHSCGLAGALDALVYDLLAAWRAAVSEVAAETDRADELASKLDDMQIARAIDRSRAEALRGQVCLALNAAKVAVDDALDALGCFDVADQ